MWSLLWKIVFLAFVQNVACSFEPVSLNNRELSSSWSDSVQKKTDLKQVLLDNEKTSKEGKSSYTREEADLKGRNEDTKSYDEKDRSHKEHDKGEHRLGETEASDRAKNAFSQHGSRYYKKGHHRTGFSNNYHKDESGNNSSFYEDSDDEGGQKAADAGAGYYGRRAYDGFRDGHRDASFTGRDRAEQGLHDNREHYDKFHGYVDGRKNNQYDDDRRNYLRDEFGRYYDKDGREIYYRREHFTPIPYSKDYRYFELPRTYHDDFYHLHRPMSHRHIPRDDYYERAYYRPEGRYTHDFHTDRHGNAYVGKYGRIYV